MDQPLDQRYETLKGLQEQVFGQIAAAYEAPREDGLERLFRPGSYTGYDGALPRSRTYAFTFMEEPYYLYATPSLAFGRLRFGTWRITVQPSSERPVHEQVAYLEFEVTLPEPAGDTEASFRFPQDEGMQRLEKIGMAYMSRFWNYIRNRDTDDHGLTAGATQP